MATVNMDRLLNACVTMGGSDVHLVVGRPPVLRIDGSLRGLETKVLESDDTVALMKSITPDRNQQELQEEGGTDFGFAFGDAGRFRVSVFKQRGNVCMPLRQPLKSVCVHFGHVNGVLTTDEGKYSGALTGTSIKLHEAVE